MNMEIENDNEEMRGPSEQTANRITGVALVLLGAVWLLNEFVEFNFGAMVLPLLALIFLLWGISIRSAALLIPGSVLAGIGAGVYLMDALPLEGTAVPGVFMLAFAGGWGLLLFLSAVFTDETMWWAIWPGGVMALIGGALLAGGPALEILSLAGRYWPVILIAIGITMLFRRR